MTWTPVQRILRTVSGYVYMMTNEGRTVLYTGVTADLAERVTAHRQGEGSEFAAQYRCTLLVWYTELQTIADAIAHEKRVKKWRRAWKEALIAEMNPDWRDLYGDLIGL